MLLCASAAAQNNLFYIWQARTQTLDSIGPFSVDQTATEDTTFAFHGYFPGIEQLSSVPPINNVFFGTNYLEPTNAALLAETEFYPARVAVKLFGWVNGVLSQAQSGVLVGEKFVLTAGHGIMDDLDPGNIFYDSLLVAPAFNNGEYNNALPTAISHRFYFPKDFFLNADLQQDICLLELDEPIGFDLGWLGIGFVNNDAFFNGKVFHRFSWPQVGFSGFDFNGDTMKYSYGSIEGDVMNNALFSTGTLAFPGESGGSWFVVTNGRHHSYGITQYSADSRHLRYSAELFYGMKGILDQNSTVGILPIERTQIEIWPQPATSVVHISIPGPKEVRLTDLQGRFLKVRISVLPGGISIDLNGLKSGVYILSIRTDDAFFSRSIIKH